MFVLLNSHVKLYSAAYLFASLSREIIMYSSVKNVYMLQAKMAH